MKNDTFNKPEILVCDCSSTQHQIVISHDKEDNLTYCHIHLVKHSFWRRLKDGIKYICGYTSKYGCFEEFILSPDHIYQLQKIVDDLKKDSLKS